MPATRLDTIDPMALLTAHQEGRSRGVRIVSVICGERPKARAMWGRWLAESERRKSHESSAWYERKETPLPERS